MSSRRHNLIAAIMVFCAVVVAAWILLAHFNLNVNRPYGLQYEDFANFLPSVEGWSIQKQPRASQIETDANIVAFRVMKKSVISDQSSAFAKATADKSVIGKTAACSPTTDQPLTTDRLPITDYRSPITDHRILIRLVHGYSMPMCMKRKSYLVEKIQDHRIRTVTDPRLKSAFTEAKGGERRAEGEGGRGDISHEGAKDAKESKQTNMDVQDTQDGEELGDSYPALSALPLPLGSYPIPIQLWRLTSGGGEVSYWATTMIRQGDFEATEEDICSMPYPRVDFPDDPNWTPRGFSRKWLKNPREEFRIWFHSKWDGANWDVLAFLRLRPTASPSEELLSYITLVHVSGTTGHEQAVADVLAVHQAMLEELQAWRGGSVGR